MTTADLYFGSEILAKYRLKVRVIPRTFSFKQPAGTSRGVYYDRQVWYVVITSPDEPRLRGLGECAPLHDLSCDYDENYEMRLRRICEDFATTHRLDDETLRRFPSIRFGLETALLSAHAALHGDFLTLFDTPFSRAEEGIPINGLVWMGRHDEMLQRMEQKLAAGYRCVKLKIGAIDFGQELDLIRRLRQRFSRETVELRVDANGAFTPEEAPQKLAELARYNLHSIEQPIKAGQWEAMTKLCRETPLPIALDEELIGVNDTAQKVALLEEIKPHYLVLKPSLHGGLSGAEEWMRLAAAHNVPYWVTSALETNIGLNAIAQWTSAVSDKIWTETKQAGAAHKELPAVHGLGTGQLFVENFHGTQLDISGDRLWIADEKQRQFVETLRQFENEWRNESETMTVQTSGSTGVPKQMRVQKKYMVASAQMTCSFLRLHAGDTALLCMPLQYIAGKMLAVRSFVAGLKLVTIAPSSHPFAHLHFAPTFAAMTPHQVYESLNIPREATLLRRVSRLIIGGGAISDELAEKLQHFPNEVWSTYGMTETLSHIAMRRLNGLYASDKYTPLSGVRLTLNEEGCLVITAPQIGVENLVTNDRCEIFPDGTFRVLGRKDNVICSGGLKIQIEEVERRLANLPVPNFAITSVPDAEFGEAVTLLYEGKNSEATALELFCRKKLPRHEVPKHYLAVEQIPRTETGKPARAAAKDLARATAKESAI